jgi:DNA-binding FadR family transcriptional regulator
VTAQPNVGELHANLVDALGAGIVSGHLAPGQVLNLDGVSAEHGVSRSVAREAIRVLESMGMVASRRRVGITIQPAVKWNMFDPRLIRWRLGAGDRAAQLVSLSELRRGFEPVAAALAARRADPHQCRIMAAAVSDSGNEMFRALTDVVAEVLSGRTHHGMMPERPNTEAIALHDEVARAIRLQDEVAAEKAMRAIIDEAAAAVTEEFCGAEPSTSSPPSHD